jgi:hypothetical protein
MKRIYNLFSRAAVAALCLGAAGCSSHKAFTHLASGYEEVAHATRDSGDEPELARISFEFHGTDGKDAVIWPSLYGVGEVIKGDLAIFVGDMAYVDEGARGVRPRLFAVQAPGLPLDITDEILWRWSKANRKDFTKALEKFSLVIPVEKNGRLELQLEFYSDDKDWPDKSALRLDWNEVSEITRAVQAKGVLEKDLHWHTPYIGEKF